MDWNTMLEIQIGGTVVTFFAVAWVTHLGLRYRKELPKLPVLESIEALKTEKESLDLEINELRESLYEAKNTIEEAGRQRQWLDEHREEVEQIGQKLDKLEKVKIALETTQTELEKLEATLSEAETKRGDLMREIAALDAKWEVQKEDLGRLEKLKNERDTLETCVPKLRVEVASLETQIRGFTEEKAKIFEQTEKLLSKHSRMTGEVTAMESERESLVEHLKALRADVKRAGGLDPDKDPCEDLWEPYFVEKTKLGGTDRETDRLHQMLSVMTNIGIQLPRRTLYAFHTALKTQDLSPITVLAGISGTGKSLVPRLYAKCMGMSFLNLPVQPGWNSPHDLFGFYNYIEHKYKATTLARAMVQFSQYDRHVFSTEESRDSWPSRMLLVLLDEMNLARIEYYFSELLSRLEVRRDINENDPAERMKVAIPLEIGHGTQKFRSLSLYPSRNVLFTGTMNEDESTQSLSDKVLDRATVLRFGRPRSPLIDQPKTSSVPTSEQISFSTWGKWCSNTESHNSQTKEIVHQLGDIMQEVGSPFGHRVAQGISRYIALYPDKSSEGNNSALSDQIEQKVLPKLRGLDLDTVRKPVIRLSNLARSLGDGHLADEIRNRAASETGSFIWSGLDRHED
jgi:predicted  nucleic acid-binding Zn-ribbon protein